VGAWRGARSSTIIGRRPRVGGVSMPVGMVEERCIMGIGRTAGGSGA
jgi:hypothetical protein